MTSYLVYSTVALKWNKKIQRGNSYRRICLPLCLVWERRSHTSFFIKTPLPASNNFLSKVQLSKKSEAFLSANILLSLIIFSTYCTVFLKLRYHDIVAFRTKIECRLWEFGHWLTASFTSPNIVWSFLMPLWCNKHLPGQSANILIVFEFWGMFVSTGTPSVICGRGKVVLVFEIIYLFSTFKLFSMVKWLR